jgi:methionyl-tRNA formyltransferase
MEISSKKIVIWSGSAPNQKALANKLASRFNVCGLVIDECKRKKQRRGTKEIITNLIDRVRFWPVYKPWKQMLKAYNSQYKEWPEAEILRVNSINDEETWPFTAGLAPDLIIVSGTGLIKEPLVNLPAGIGIINLHTGLSPYVKGGPNCTNWCIANNNWHLVGNTIMWLSAGIDSGNIITTETIDVCNKKTLYDAHNTVMEHAHILYIKAVNYLLSNPAPYQSVPQDSIARGTLFLTKMWTADKKKHLLKNWKKRKSYLPRQTEKIKTIPLPQYQNLH